jgi:hypothetical protein
MSEAKCLLPNVCRAMSVSQKYVGQLSVSQMLFGLMFVKNVCWQIFLGQMPVSQKYFGQMSVDQNVC